MSAASGSGFLRRNERRCETPRRKAFAPSEYNFIYYMNPYLSRMKGMAFPAELGHKGPTLETLHMVETVLRRSDEPLSLNRIKTLLPRKVVHRTPREAIRTYKRLGFPTPGAEGVP